MNTIKNAVIRSITSSLSSFLEEEGIPNAKELTDRYTVKHWHAKDKNKKSKKSGYILFSNSMRAGVTERIQKKYSGEPKKMIFNKVMVELGKLWKALPDSEKEGWKTKANVANGVGSSSSASAESELLDESVHEEVDEPIPVIEAPKKGKGKGKKSEKSSE